VATLPAFAIALDVARVEGQARQEEFTNIIMEKHPSTGKNLIGLFPECLE
jgi:hypothetical protein